MISKRSIFLCLLFLNTVILRAQERPAAPPVSKGQIKSYKDVITEKALSKKGLFSTHKVDDKWFFEIPDSILGREIIAVTRVAKMSGGSNNYGGEIANQQTLSFEKGPNNNIFIRDITYIDGADSSDRISKAVTVSNLHTIAFAFPVAAYGENTTVIDVTEFFKGDNQIVSLSPNSLNPFTVSKRRFNLGSLMADRSYVQAINTYPINTEIKTVKTFAALMPTAPAPGTVNLPAAQAAGSVTIELNTSLLLLPKVPMGKRLFDPRVGYFANQRRIYSDDQQKVNSQTFILRWRLEPKPEDTEKWKRGELVEPAKPIVYYIDPATPKQWVPYLIQGVNDWQKAFEQAGFKNAITAKEWPDDPNMSMEDARYSVLRYFASDILNAYGPNISDPRSGEILESHIGWYHNVMQLLHDWYMVQTAAVDPAARKMKYDEELMGELIRIVSSHEVGHTLGLRHNWGSSSKTPVEKLRDKNWLAQNGHTASIMDYARFNYVAQPEDGVTRKELFPRIGDYDKWAIEWGYKYRGDLSAEDDYKLSNKLILQRVPSNPRLWFGTEQHPTDPRSQNEDLGDDAMKAGEYGIKNLQRIMAGLPEWTKEEGNRYSNLDQVYDEITVQFGRYAGHVLKNIGGVEETPKSVEEQGEVFTPTIKEKQQAAMKFLINNVFNTPKWLMASAVVDKIRSATENPVGSVQTSILKSLISPARLNRIALTSARFGSGNYSLIEMMTELQNGLWEEKSATAGDVYKRNLQKLYIDLLSDILHTSSTATPAPPQGPPTAVQQPSADVQAAARGKLTELKSRLNAAKSTITDKIIRYHYEQSIAAITAALEAKN